MDRNFDKKDLKPIEKFVSQFYKKKILIEKKLFETE